MFCSSCGKELSDDTKFCNHCGTQQAAGSQEGQAPVSAEKQTAKKQPKKGNILVTVAVVLCAFLIGKFVLAPSMVSDNSGSSTNYQGGQSQQPGDSNNSASTDNTPSAEYEAVFDGSYIVHFQAFFNMDMANFASKQDNGIIACSDYGYEDDVVKQWVETIYIPVSDYTDTQKTELENTLKTQFATVDALNCCAVAYKMSANYFTVTCTYSDVDKAENYGELYHAQILETNTFISMSATENILLTQGFVKK